MKLQTKYLLEFIKSRAKLAKECVTLRHFKIGPMKKPIKAWLWLAEKITENSYCLQLFTEFTETQKRYPTSLDESSILC